MLFIFYAFIFFLLRFYDGAVRNFVTALLVIKKILSLRLQRKGMYDWFLAYKIKINRSGLYR